MFSKSAEQMSESTAKATVSDAHEAMIGQYLDSKTVVSAADKGSDLGTAGTGKGVLPALDLVDNSKCMGGAPDSKCGVATSAEIATPAATTWVKPDDNGTRPVKPEPTQADGDKPHKLNDNGLRPVKPELEVRHPIYKDVTGNGDMRLVQAGVDTKPVVPNPGMEVTDKKPGIIKPDADGKPGLEGKPAGSLGVGMIATPVDGLNAGKPPKILKDADGNLIKDASPVKDFKLEGKKDVKVDDKKEIDQAAIDAKIRAYKESLLDKKEATVKELTPEQLAAIAAKKAQANHSTHTTTTHHQHHTSAHGGAARH